jgi:hypothetical protein
VPIMDSCSRTHASPDACFVRGRKLTAVTSQAVRLELGRKGDFADKAIRMPFEMRCALQIANHASNDSRAETLARRHRDGGTPDFGPT